MTPAHGTGRAAADRAAPAVEAARPAPNRRVGPERARRALGNRAVGRLHEAGGLDPQTRALMELRFGRDFGGVHIHTGPAAESAAASVGARAFTVGPHIVFGRGAYDPASSRGRRVLAHELAHVVQQERGGTAGKQAVERDAEQAAEAFTAHPSAPVVVREASAIRMSRTEEDSLGPGLDQAIDVIGAALGGGGIRGRMFAAALRGFVAEMSRQLSGESLARFKTEIVALAVPGNAAQFGVGYGAGAVAGLVSPVTDLLGLLGFLQQLPGMAVAFASRLPGAETLAAEAEQLVRDARAWLGSVGTTIRGLDLKLINEYLELAGQKATDAAGAAGRGAARSVVELFTKAGEEEATPSSAPAYSLTGILDAASRTRQSLLSSKWNKTGYSIGHAVGAVVSNVLLLVFSEGLGNAIAEIGAWLGKFGGLLAQAGELAVSIGKGIEVVEQAIAVVGGKLAKPFEPVLKPLLDLLGRLRAFLRKLLGVAEKGAATAVATAGATGVEKKLAGAAPKPTATGRPKVRVATGKPPPRTRVAVPETEPVGELDDVFDEKAWREAENARRAALWARPAPHAQPGPRKAPLPTTGERPVPKVIPAGGDRAAVMRRAQETELLVQDVMTRGNPSGGVRTQVTILEGRPAVYATRGASRLDVVVDELKVAIDAKNYNLVSADGRRRLVRDATSQAIERARLGNLPRGYRQALVIDARGQRVVDREMSQLLDDLIAQSGGQFTAESIWIVFDESVVPAAR